MFLQQFSGSPTKTHLLTFASEAHHQFWCPMLPNLNEEENEILNHEIHWIFRVLPQFQTHLKMYPHLRLEIDGYIPIILTHSISSVLLGQQTPTSEHHSNESVRSLASRAAGIPCREPARLLGEAQVLRVELWWQKWLAHPHLIWWLGHPSEKYGPSIGMIILNINGKIKNVPNHQPVIMNDDEPIDNSSYSNYR